MPSHGHLHGTLSAPLFFGFLKKMIRKREKEEEGNG